MKERQDDIRLPAVAGMFYPDDSAALQRTVDRLLDSVTTPVLKEDILSMIVPHAGYAYSGSTAAHAFAAIRGREIDTVIAVGPSHRDYFDGISVYPGRAYRTPLGDVEIDGPLRTQLTDQGILRSLAGHRAEHSVEVQLPFLQRVLPRFTFVPLIMGSQSRENCVHLADALAHVAQGRKVLILASSDLSHFHPQHEALERDARVRGFVERFDAEGLLQQLEGETVEACGGGPMIAVMRAGKLLGATRIRVLDCRTSGDVTGDLDSVVGYMSAAIVREN
jgi:AmmeMemoRadiSam system protein B